MKIDATDRLAEELIDVLAVTPTGDDEFVGSGVSSDLTIGTGRLFGGLLAAQALASAQACTPADRPAVSFHCRFLRPGAESCPVHYRVSRDMDGRTLTHRRIVAYQGGRPILTASAAFQSVDTGPHHQPVVPETDSPEAIWETLAAQLRSGNALPHGLRNYVNSTLPVQAAVVDPAILDCTEPRVDKFLVWIRFPAPLGRAPITQQAILTYLSDMVPFRPVDRRHGLCPIRGEVVEASLDHAIWFHDDVRTDEWMLFSAESDWSGRGRGLGQANVFSRDGRLLATIAQEGVFRLPAERAINTAGQPLEMQT